jgi:creatinine deaminase
MPSELLKDFTAADHERFMGEALKEATQGCLEEKGCPIGAILVDAKTKEIVGRGHNRLVQEGNPTLHGEMSAMRNAGRMPSRSHLVMYTSLQPCWMCTGTIVQFAIPAVVVGDALNASSDETIAFLQSRGIEAVVLSPEHSPAAKGCVDLCRGFRETNPDLWLEDWGGPRLPK